MDEDENGYVDCEDFKSSTDLMLLSEKEKALKEQYKLTMENEEMNDDKNQREDLKEFQLKTKLEIKNTAQ